MTVPLEAIHEAFKQIVDMRNSEVAKRLNSNDPKEQRDASHRIWAFDYVMRVLEQRFHLTS